MTLSPMIKEWINWPREDSKTRRRQSRFYAGEDLKMAESIRCQSKGGYPTFFGIRPSSGGCGNYREEELPQSTRRGKPAEGSVSRRQVAAGLAETPVAVMYYVLDILNHRGR